MRGLFLKKKKRKKKANSLGDIESEVCHTLVEIITTDGKMKTHKFNLLLL